MDYDEALAFLDRHTNLEKSGAIAGRVEGLSLEPMRRLMHVLGDPQHAYPVIHVTGTNGKGSTARMIAEVLAAHGLRVGLYTSPHVERINERLWWSGDPELRVDGDGEVFERWVDDPGGRARRELPEDRADYVTDEELIGMDEGEVLARVVAGREVDTFEDAEARPGGAIDDADFAAVLSEVAELEPLAGLTASYFELCTAAALLWFSELPVDVAVVEVGLLGRYDATNVVDAAVAVVTNVGQDHTDFTGDWRADIAREKAGIIKPGSVVVLGETDPELVTIFDDEPSAGVVHRDDDFGVEVNRTAVGGRLVDVRTPAGTLEDLFVPLHGEHQGDNAALALAAVEAFFGRGLDVDVTQAGLMRVQVPGRFEVIGRSPLVIVDGAHNPDGAAVVAQTLEDDFEVAGRRIYVIGMLAGRDITDFLEGVGVRSADLVIACAPDTPRAVPADEVARVARDLGAPAEAVASVGEAIERARAVAAEEDVILVTGSLYTAGEALAVGRAAG